MLDATFSVIESEEQRNELAVFCSKYKNRFYYIALSKLHNAEEAEDAVQEVFSEIADKPESFFDIAPEKRISYIDVMVRNISIDMYKAKARTPVEQLDEQIEYVSVSLDDELLGKIARNEIAAFINKLPSMQHNVLMLHCFFGLSIDEVSQKLGISLTAANKLLTRARKAIREFIDERNDRI